MSAGISRAMIRSKIEGASGMGSILRNPGHEPPGAMMSELGCVPERAVEADAVRIRAHPVRREELGLPALAEVPVETHARHREVGPAVGEPEGAEVDVGGPAPVVVEQGVRGARVAVAHDQLLDGRRRAEFGAGGGGAACEALLGRPAERAGLAWEVLVQGAEALTDGAGGGARFGAPALRDRGLPGEGAGDEQFSGPVDGVVEHLRHGVVRSRPREAVALGGERDRRAGGVPLGEDATVVVAEGQPALLVAPDRLRVADASPHGIRNRHWGPGWPRERGHQRPIRALSTASAAGPAVEVRSTSVPSRASTAPDCRSLSSSRGATPPSGPTTSVTRSASSSATAVSGTDAVGSSTMTRPGSAASCAV